MSSYFVLAFLFFSGSFIYNIEAIPKFGKQALKAINEYRASHDAPPLVWNSTIAKYALRYAQTLAANGVMKHNPHSPYGENIYFKKSSTLNPIDGKLPIRSWYNEIENYDFVNPRVLNKTSHFIQLVWKDTTQLGMAFVTTNEYETWVVAYFSPKGNNPQKFRENVSPRIDLPSTTNDLTTNT